MEAYLLDFDGEIYDRVCTLTFVGKLREEQSFDSLDACGHRLKKMWFRHDISSPSFNGSYAPPMPTTKVYEYKGCSTCRKALKWLEAQGIEYKAVPVRETPPNKTELRRVLKASEGNIRKLFNTPAVITRS